MKKRTAGLLPLYLELYDRVEPEARGRMEAFLGTVAGELRNRNIEVLDLPICRLKEEFARAVALCEASGVDAIITLHLAYSPSLEAAEVLAATELPLIVLDTTPSYGFGPGQKSSEIMFNHGIHGVQDLCNLLKRKGKKFFIEAGHWRESDVVDRIASRLSGAAAASAMRGARVGSVGEPFPGMGDFALSPERLKADLGMETVFYDFAAGEKRLAFVSDAEVEAEIASIGDTVLADGVSPAALRETVRTGLALRGWMLENGLTAFTVNFLATDAQPALPRMPFLEACFSMARGIGYAGEGDVMTAALVGALLSVLPETTFTEMFCPDWEHDAVFLSHMGEMNTALMADLPRLAEQDFTYTRSENPVAAYGRLKTGDACLVNLAPGAGGRYSLILIPGSIPETTDEDTMGDTVRGWFKSALPLPEFLQRYSLAGGTHHIALSYGKVLRELETFAALMGWDLVVIA